MFCFFFQAEDGIRDLTVTGVQTCALPISPSPQAPTTPRANSTDSYGVPSSTSCSRRVKARSEERRVGKEGRSRWLRDHVHKDVAPEGRNSNGPDEELDTCVCVSEYAERTR